jgi:hypothetical protein
MSSICYRKVKLTSTFKPTSTGTPSFIPGAKLPLAQRRDGTFVEPQPEATDKLEDFQ